MVRRAVLVGLLLLVWSTTSATAHTAVRRAEPGPGQTVSGVVDRVVLEFLDPVQPTPEIVVHGPDGALVPGLRPATMLGDDAVERRFDPLVEPGAYRVDYTFVAGDGAEQTEAHQFRFVPSDDGDGGGSWRWLLAVGVAVAGVAALVASVRSRRRDAAGRD